MACLRSAWVEVDHAAVTENVRSLRAAVGEGVRFMAVVKADGYGHGDAACAKAALAGGADRLGVATVEEAVGLREAGITAPLHLLTEPPEDASDMVAEHRLIPAVFTREVAESLSKAAERSRTPVDFHLKVDTGMNRIGVRAEEAADFIESLAGLPGLRMEGVFTHFATAEVPGDWDFDAQMSRFRGALEGMTDRGMRPGLVHAANSAAAVLHPESRLGMVRCGIAVYGLHPGDVTRERIALLPAMSVKARVARVQRVPMGEGVSYGLTYRTAQPTTIATLPLGYADGVHRVLSNRMRVLIGGTACRQVGRICMDQLMVEVPRGLEVSRGDEAVLVGTQGAEAIGMDELAGLGDTINYEVACGFSMRLERRPV